MVSDIILHYLALSANIGGFLTSSDPTWYYLTLSRTILRCLAISGTASNIWKYLELFVIIWQYLAISGTILNTLALALTI